jgi:hypothetical protein
MTGRARQARPRIAHARLARARLAAVASLLVASMAAPRPTAAAADVRVGFDGVYRTGSWTPLEVSFAQPQPPTGIAAWVEDPDGQFVRSPVAPVVTGTDGRPTARLVVRFGRPAGRVVLEEVAAGSAAAADRRLLPITPLPPPLPAAEQVLLVLGELPTAERAARLLSRDDGSRPRVVAVDPARATGGAGGAATLGRSARDYDGADTIIICGRGALAAEPEVLAGIDAWTLAGGQLVVCAGTTAVEIDRAGGVAAGWLPGAVSKLVPLRRANALETFARASRPLDKAAVAGLQVPLFRNAQAISGTVEAFEGRDPSDMPLVVRRAHGFGTIVWVGVDLDRPPFRDWSGSDSLLVEMLRGRRAGREAGRSGETERGSFDLAAQLRQAIDQFRGVASIPFEVIAGLGLLYVVSLYPLDWWLAAGRGGDAAGRFRSTATGWERVGWISLPLLVAAASWCAWYAGQRWKGTQWRASAAELVDFDLASGRMRAAAFAGLWSPVNDRLSVAAGPAAVLKSAAEAPRGDVTWFAAGGRGIGGTDAVAAHPSLAAGDYAYDGSSERLAGLPIAAASSRLFEAELEGRAGRPPVESTLEREGQGTLTGAVTNRLPFALQHCVLAHAGWLYEVGRLGPGESFAAGTGRGPRSLAGAITRRTIDKDRDVAMRWDLGERDPLRILEVAGFHAAAGGSSYTAVEPGRLARFDLSALLPLDRAVLVGRGPAPVTWTWRASAATDLPSPPADTALWRIVIPLRSTSAAAALSAPAAPPPPGIDR